MSSLFRPRQSFLQNNSWQNSALNALKYNTAQQGSVVPLIYGTVRQPVNLIDMDGYRGPKGKKGKTGSLPISGTHQSGKGGGGGKGKGDKKSHQFSINIDFAICQGPVPPNPGGAIYSSSGVAQFSSMGLNFYSGADGQAPDGHFNKIGYSGTCHMTGTPLVLGQSPVVPNIGLEVSGILAGYHTGGYSKDANPGDVIIDFLTNVRYGCGFPVECLTRLSHDETGASINTYGDYCQATSLLISTSLDGHQKAIEWINGLVTLTNSALVWSGRYLKIIPYGDLSLNNNGASWAPDMAAKYNLTDRDFLPFSPHQDGNVPNPGDDDPIIVTRTNPADADNWISIEYTDRLNFYNSTVLTAFDQGAIDTYGLRIGDSLPGRAFCNATSAQIALQLILQRRIYIRNTGIKFQLGWQFALLEPMDMVSISGRFGDLYLNQYPVRITAIEENDNGDLTITGEDPQPGASAPVTYPKPVPAVHWPYPGPVIRWGWTIPYSPVYDWFVQHPPDGPKGTFSMWLQMDESTRPRRPGEEVPGVPGSSSSGDVYGMVRTSKVAYQGTGGPATQLAVCINWDLSIFVYLGGIPVYRSVENIVHANMTWDHILVTWDCRLDPSGLTIVPIKSRAVRVWVNGQEYGNDYTIPVGKIISDKVYYSFEGNLFLYSAQNFIEELGYNLAGCSNYWWWDGEETVNDPNQFRNLNGTPRDLGFRGEYPLGRPPKIYLAWDGEENPGYILSGPILPGAKNYNINRAGYKCDDGAYWDAIYPTDIDDASWRCDPEHPTMGVSYLHPTPCNGPTW